MNAFQIITILFASITVGIDGWAIVTILRSHNLKCKPLWIVGSLFGFVGLGINWTNPNNIFFEFGIQVPVISAIYFANTGEVAAKIMFPIIALAALIRIWTAAEQPSFGPRELNEAE